MSYTTARCPLWFVFVLALAVTVPTLASDREANRIQPWEKDPRYWQYYGEPIFLIGGSNSSSLFGTPDREALAAQLDLLTSVNGNYVRNGIAGGRIWEFYRDPETGLFDLTRFNDTYWERLQEFLDMTAERDIVVQIEVWERFNFYRGSWEDNPFNPKNNVNYTSEETGIPEVLDSHPGQRQNPFFRSLPELEDIAVLVPFQEARVRKILELTLEYDHVLYCISNETNDTEQWSAYWANLLRAEAAKRGNGIEVTEMWDDWDITSAMHRRTYDHPERYSFVDTSQNNHQRGQAHWDNMQTVRRMIADPPRPMNNIKIYGGERHGGGIVEGTNKFWRNILGGVAASRFHRSGQQYGWFGIGLSELAQTHLLSASMFSEEFDVFAAEPDNGLLSDRQENEAYCAADLGRQYAVYFVDGGSVELDLSADSERYTLRWLDILNSRWHGGESSVSGGGSVRLTAPGEKQWMAVLTR